MWANNVYRFWGTLVVYAAIELFGTCASVLWLRGSGRVWLIASASAYVICIGLWLFAIAGEKGPSLTRALAIYPLWALLAGVATGLVMTDDNLTIRDWVGLVLGTAAIILLGGEGEN